MPLSIEKFPKEEDIKRSCGSVKNNEVNKKHEVFKISLKNVY